MVSDLFHNVSVGDKEDGCGAIFVSTDSDRRVGEKGGVGSGRGRVLCALGFTEVFITSGLWFYDGIYEMWPLGLSRYSLHVAFGFIKVFITCGLWVYQGIHYMWPLGLSRYSYTCVCALCFIMII